MSGQELSCQEVERLLGERASGPLEPEQAAALERHLAGCLSCRAAAERDRRLFALLALPPPGPAEEAALRALPERALAAWHGAERRRRKARAAAVAAAILLAVALPLGRWKSTQPGLSASEAADPAEVELSQVEWSAPAWDVDEGAAAEEDTPFLDALALEGDGAFSLGDSG